MRTGAVFCGEDRRFYKAGNYFQVTAEVVDKEYCQARKPENRFKVNLAA